jgi:DNA-binding NtrC family response regulator
MELFRKLRKLKILLIDDDEWIRDSLCLFFSNEGCHLTACETAEEGIEALRNQDYDIVITDYRLPGMDGLNFLKELSAINPSVKKILLTAYGNKDIIDKAYRLGIHDFIEKPFSSETVEAALLRVVENHFHLRPLRRLSCE